MVTHDKELARAVPYKIEIADGRINGVHGFDRSGNKTAGKTE
jgi:ABC-type lipoprotein export system ATPase subunit